MELQSKRRLSAKGLLFFFWLNLLFFPVAIYSVAGAETGKVPLDLSTAIVQVAKTNIPAVVHIEVTERQEVENPMAPFGSDPFLRHFFNIPKMPKKFKRELRGLGSGILIDTQGHILTNHHYMYSGHGGDFTELQSKRQLSAKGLLFFFWLNLPFFPVAIYSVAGAETGKIPGDLSTAIVQVAKTNIPAVVHIETTERQEVENPLAPFGSDPFFRHFFNIPQTPKKFKRELRGLGSGMIIDTQGHILTNHHVVGGANKIEVLLSDGRRFTGKLVGSDPKTDLALGDIILAVDQQPVEGVDGFIQIMEALKPKAKVTLVALDHRSGNVGTVVVGPIP